MKRLEDEIKDLEIGILVNNVGMSYEYPEEYLSIENGEENVRRMVACNIGPVNTLTRLILPGMVQRGKGAVINISSFTALFPMPMLSVYAASKAYVAQFTQGLEAEYRFKGILFQCVMPRFVCTKMSKIRKPTLFIPTPEVFVASALHRLGRQSFTTGYWAHELQTLIMHLTPTWINTKMTLDQMKSTRARALKKKEKAS